LQGDEILHEDDLPRIQASLAKAELDPRVEGLYFDYLHFFGSARTLATGPAWYRREVRVVRNAGLKVVMPSDAQYFTAIDGRKRLRYLKCNPSGARIFHYGWARSPATSEHKQREASAYYHQPASVRTYTQIDPKCIQPFDATHPGVAREWIAEHASGTFVPDPNYRLSTRDKRQRAKQALERLLGVDTSKDHFVRLS
jgi:hypothetical protein